MDYKMWFRMIKEYRRFRPKFILPKAICSSWIDMRGCLDTMDMAKAVEVVTGRSEMDKNPLLGWKRSLDTNGVEFEEKELFRYHAKGGDRMESKKISMF
jgi:hypothetical protein